MVTDPATTSEMFDTIAEEAVRAYEQDPAREIAFSLIQNTALDLIEPSERKAAQREIYSIEFRAALTVLAEYVQGWVPEPSDFLRWSKSANHRNRARAKAKSKLIKRCAKTRQRYVPPTDHLCIDCGATIDEESTRCRRCAKAQYWRERAAR